MDRNSKILSDVVIWSKYAKFVPALGRRETWDEVITRNRQMHIDKFPHLEDEIKQAYEYVYRKEVFPSMRSLQFAGKPIEVSNIRMFNCSYLPMDNLVAFSELMFLLLSGAGVGYSVQSHHVNKLPTIRHPTKSRRYLVPDSIEGWSEAIRMLMKCYLGGRSLPDFDFSDIRPKGAALITSGGKAPGPQPLKDCIFQIQKLFDSKPPNSKLTPIDVHDINCFIADAVLTGGIRRSAMISLFDLDDEAMLTAKSGEWWNDNPQRGRSNNSAVILRHRIKEPVFTKLWDRIEKSGCGEPGFFFTNDKDWGLNPCAEISLRAFQTCNLTSMDVSQVTTQEEFNERAKAAAFIGTLQASYTNFHYLRDVWKEVAEKEALLGVSMTGIASGNVLNLNMAEAAQMVLAENERVAALIGINMAARATCVKPEGCQVADTLVATNEGIVELGELGDVAGDKWQDTVGKTILTDRGYESLGKFFNNGVAKTKKILLSSGLTLESTVNHQYRVIRGDDYIWVEANQILPDDIFPYDVGGYIGGSYQTVNYNMEYNSLDKFRTPFPPSVTIDEEFAWFLGLYFADGSVHSRGIRIYGNWEEQKGFDRVCEFMTTRFGIVPKLIKNNDDSSDKRCYLAINSVGLNKFLMQSGLKKGRSFDIELPRLLRMSPASVLKAFYDGFILGDGNSKIPSRPSFVTTSEKFAHQSVIVMRLIGMDARLRMIPFSKRTGAFGKRTQYWISVRAGRAGVTDKQRLDIRNTWNVLDAHGLSHLSADTVVSVEDSYNYTVDIEVPATQTYIANSYVSHNTLSLVAGSSSGIHAWHNDFFIRRMRLGKNESIYSYLANNHPELIEDDYFKPQTQAILSVPIKAPNDVIIRTESANDLLTRVSKVWQEWVQTGHRKGQNVNNVSTTVSIKPDEWQGVGEWMWNHRGEYTALSVLPYDNGTYVQAPFEDIDGAEYYKLSKHLHDIDVTQIIETDDNTTLTESVACGGGGCETVSI